MTESIPKFLLENVAMLFAEMNYSFFSFEDAVSIMGQSPNYTGSILGRLVRCGWLEKQPAPDDRRKKHYRVRPLETVLSEIGQS